LAIVAIPLLVSILTTATSTAAPPLSVAVSGNHLVDQNGTTVVLRGAKTSGSE
jgi:hypothetical protein